MSAQDNGEYRFIVMAGDSTVVFINGKKMDPKDITAVTLKCRGGKDPKLIIERV